MNVFIYYIGMPTPVFETHLELIRNHDLAGDTVRVLQCTGLLSNCHFNPNHVDSECAICKSKFKNGWKALNPGDNVELFNFPKLSIDSSEFPKFNSLDEIKKFKYDGQNIGYGVVSSLGSAIGDHRFSIERYRDEIIRELKTAIEVYTTLKKEFENFKPDLVYLFNGRVTTYLPAKLLCKHMGIDYISYEVSRKNNSYRLVRNASVHEIIPEDVVKDIRKDWNEQKRTEAESFFINKKRGKDFDKFPSFTKNQDDGNLPAGFDERKKNIAIFNSTIDEYSSIEGFENIIYEPDETAGIGIILESFLHDDRYMFYLRVHPNMVNRSYTMSQLLDIRALSSKFSNLCIIWPNEKINSYTLMTACEKVITFGSTTGIEATYWGTPSILANYAAYQNFGCVYVPKTHEQLVKLLHQNLKPLPVDYALQYIYYWVILDGIEFKYFKETNFVKGLSAGKFDGLEIRPSAISIINYEIDLLFRRIIKAVNNPSLLISKLISIYKKNSSKYELK